jgi:DNA-binding NarL/FixJ family response regulator
LKKISVLVADDDTLFREGIEALLATTDDCTVVGEAVDGNEALQKTLELKPDVVLMDINMPGVNGIAATRRILQSEPHTGILMLTMLEDDASVFAAMQAGARGFLLKGADHDELLQAIRTVASGQALIGPEIASRLLAYFQGLSASQVAKDVDHPFCELTDRELEVLSMIAEGHIDNEIARQMVISPKTVRNHVTSIFGKLQAADRALAIFQARQADLK